MRFGMDELILGLCAGICSINCGGSEMGFMDDELSAYSAKL